MNTTFPFTTCCQLLRVDPKTLRSWLTEAGIAPITSSTDSRLKLLTLEQLYQVAVVSHRAITPLADSTREVLPEETPCAVPSASPLLSAEMEPLQQKITQLEEQLVSVYDHLTRLALLMAESRQPLAAEPSCQERSPGFSLTEQEPDTPPIQGWRPLPVEQRARTHLLPVVEYGEQSGYIIISPQEGEVSLEPDSLAWFAWLASLTSFRFVGKLGRLSAYRVSKSGHPTRSWKASRCAHDREYRVHLGITPHLTVAHLEQAAATLHSRIAGH